MNLQGRDLKLDRTGEDVKLLHSELAQLGFSVTAAEQQQAFFGQATYAAVQRFQAEHHLPPTGVVDAATAKAINQALEASKAEAFVVSGRVFSADRAGVGGLRVQVVDKNPGPDIALAAGVSDTSGGYSLQYPVQKVKERCKDTPDIQVRVYAGEVMLGASEVRYNAGPKEMLDVLVPPSASNALASEHETLTGALATHFKGNLRDLKESDDRQDVTYLANKSGWDARAVALAALADQFSQFTATSPAAVAASASSVNRTANPSPTTTSPAAPVAVAPIAPTVLLAPGGPPSAAGIQPAFYYALFRAGLPANADTLYRADTSTVVGIWKQAIGQGVIPKTLETEIPRAQQAFQALGAQKLLTGPAFIGVSSLEEMLAVARLNETQQRQFVTLYTANRADMPAFWKAVSAAFGQDLANQLQVDGKLAFLTINNAPLMQQLHNVVGGGRRISDPLQLAAGGYHRAAKWTGLLTAGVPIPKEIPGEGDVKRLNYAEYLAAQVRLSYPTAAVAEMVGSGDLLPVHRVPKPVRDSVQAFLTAHQGEFEIGAQPVQQYLARKNITLETPVLTEVKRLQRVYQITPGDQAMSGLLKRGIDAAYHVVRYQKEAFVENFAHDVGGPDAAGQIYDRSVQVHNAVLNIAVSYLTARNGIQLGASPLKAADQGSQNGGQILQPAPKGSSSANDRRLMLRADTAPNAGDVIAYPTLEKLFGSMDFCACDHCRSILSPAAYLVDLLHFIDQEPTDTDKVANPKATNPQAVLLERRPDIQHLPLTCENTNTAMPYIDVVNETLEYFIVSNPASNPNKKSLSLDGYLGHDTDGAVSSEDLLASPRFVTDAAYTTLSNEFFPAPLPFHQPLENVRRCFDKFGVPLPLAMEKLRQSEDLERGSNAYGWRDILIEQLRLSRAEYHLLTNWDIDKAAPAPLTLQQIYGFASGTEDEAVAELSNAKRFARRLEITYDDLVSLLRTRFINPNSGLIPKVERLGVSFADLQAFHDKNEKMKDADFDALLAQNAVPPDPAEYGGALDAPKNDYKPIREWVRNDNNFNRIKSLIVLTNTDPKITETGVTPCNFDSFEFRHLGDASAPLDAVEFVRLLRFIRLWKKIGWTIEQTDAAICALFPIPPFPDGADAINKVDKLDKGFSLLLPWLGIVVRVMNALNLRPRSDLLSLLACWSDIGTHGDSALYRQMFLNPAVLRHDPVFADNGYGEFLTDTSQTLMATDSVKKAMIAGAITPNDVLTTLINGVAIPYKVVAADTTVTALAAKIVLAINATTTKDPIAGVPLNQVVLASSAAGIITIKAVTPDSSFTLACSPSPGATETYATVDHEPALRAALNLTGDEFSLITTALQFDAATQLNLANISKIYRRGWLARKMRLSVRELLLLISLTGLDPFAAPDLPSAASPAILGLIALVQALKDRSLKSAAALYLIWNQDLGGKSTPDPRQVLDLARTLRGDFAAIDDQFAATEDPDGNIARARMTLVYGQETTDAFFALLDDTAVVDVAYPHGEPEPADAIAAADSRIVYNNVHQTLSYVGVMSAKERDALKAAAIKVLEAAQALTFQLAIDDLFARTQGATEAPVVPYVHHQPTLEDQIAAAASRISYDAFRHRLSHDGLLSDTIQTKLQGVNGVTPDFKDAVNTLHARSEDLKGSFFARHQELDNLYRIYTAPADPPDALAKKRAALLAAFDPQLAHLRKRQQAVQRLSAAARVDLGFTQALLDASFPKGALYPLHAAGDKKDQPALNDALALETEGLAPQVFFGDAAKGNPDLQFPELPAVANLDYARGSANPLPFDKNAPDKAISGIWSGQLEVPEAGFYNIVIEADAGANVTLSLGGQSVALTLPMLTTPNIAVWRNAGPLELKAGTFNQIIVTVEKVKDVLSVKWETPKRSREVIPGRFLYPEAILKSFSNSYVRFLKVASLASGLLLTANEMVHFATDTDYQIPAINGDGWLNALAVSGDPDTPTAAALLKPFQALLDFARIKAALSPGDERLLTVLQDPASATAKADSLLFTLSRWDKSSLGDLLKQYAQFGFGGNFSDLKHFELFRRVYDAFTFIKKMGIPASALIEGATNDPDGNTVRDLQAALRARYAAADWRDVIQPINNEMRGLQRDALVACILHHFRESKDSDISQIDTADKLFEYFLMDVQMEPCMQTSRIRHALSSVQLFTERCLMNLEPRVLASSINAQQWAWMKRYRVWEANRKVFIWPENWLEPELRDDKSPFFKEIESELLQSDITEDSATTALLNYLSKLEEVAKLELCGMYYVESTGVMHVIARTAGAHRKYYYRRLEDRWTPWEQVKLDIEDNPVMLVVWNGRLLLFWLRILKKGPDKAQKFQNNQDGSPANLSNLTPGNLPGDPQITIQAVLCWSEYYNGKWQPTKTSDVNNPVDLDSGAVNAFDRSKLTLSVGETTSGLGIQTQGAAFLLYNTHSLPVPAVLPPPSVGQKTRSLISSDTFSVSYSLDGSRDNSLERDVLGSPVPPFSTTEPRHPLQNVWDAPFFFEDSRHVFYVTTAEQQVPINDYAGIGLIGDRAFQRAGEVPPLILKGDPPKEARMGVDIVGFNPGVIDSAPIRRFVTEDAYIHQGLGTTGSVKYGGSQIGPAGALLNVKDGR